MKEFRNQYSEPLNDFEVIDDKSPVVNGQALTCSELFRRISSGLSVGCAVRNFDQINPFLEKFSIYDAISQFKIRHGMVEKSELDASQTPQGSTEKSPESSEETK